MKPALVRVGWNFHRAQPVMNDPMVFHRGIARAAECPGGNAGTSGGAQHPAVYELRRAARVDEEV